MNRKNLLLSLAIVLCLVVGGLGLVSGASATVQTYTLDWSVVGSGGDASAQLGSTVGQTATGWSVGNRQLGSGFWYGIARANYAIYLPLVARNR